MEKRRFWTLVEIDTFTRLYPVMATKKLARIMKRSVASLYRASDFYGVKKSDEYLRTEYHEKVGKRLSKAGRSHQFKKGHVPANKGRKGYYQPGSEKGWFKKGHLPHNTLPRDGVITLRWIKTGHRGEKVRRKFIRTSLGKSMELKNYVWKKHRGRIPRGMCVTFRSSDHLDCRLSNLKLISLQEKIIAARNSDRWIAGSMARVKAGKRGALYDQVLLKEILRRPDLIEAKRRQLQLQSMLKGGHRESI